MLEFSIARKYLIPRKKELSVALISLMSVGVISLVVWLILVFLSVTEGIERSWLEKLTALNAPLRITPTAKYYNSYYYQVDSVSSASSYTYKTIGEKRRTPVADPYSPECDREIPSQWPLPERDAEGKLKDPVQGLFSALAELKEKRVPSLAFQDYEMGGALLRLELHREGRSPSFLTQASYLASFADTSPYMQTLLLEPNWVSHQRDAEDQLHSILPKGVHGEGVILPKSLQEAGVRMGDCGALTYSAAAASSMQEQRLPVYVAGFYDPGIMAAGSRCLLASHTVVHAINAASNVSHFDPMLTNGVQVWCADIDQTEEIREGLQQALTERGIDSYWKITTFREYDFAKDFLEQFQSDKYLFSLVGIIILLVGCSNIISLLVLLVNDKKKEIGILQAMGATRFTIAAIFGLCGFSMGIISSAAGSVAAFFTLRHIDQLVALLSTLQGHNPFNAIFYGKTLPNTLSHEALLFISIATPLLSLAAGLVPAIKACRLSPSAILRAE